MENLYTGIVYQNPNIKVNKKTIEAIENIKSQELLLVEHIFMGPYEICHSIIRDNEYLFNNLEPCDIMWNENNLINDTAKMNQYAINKMINNCAKNGEGRLIFGIIDSKIGHSCSPNVVSFPYSRVCKYLEICYTFTYSIKNISKGDTLTGIPCASNVCNCGTSTEERKKFFKIIDDMSTTIRKREMELMNNIILKYESSLEGKTIMMYQYLAHNGIRCAGINSDLALYGQRFLNISNEKYSTGSIEEKQDKFKKNAKLIFDTLIGKTVNFRDRLLQIDMNECKNNIICLIASHLNNYERIDNFNELLNDINSQLGCENKTIKISLSCDNGLNISKTLELIEEYGFGLNHSKKKLSQFEHYKILVNQLKIDDPSNTWIIFSDDDDIWNEKRIVMYDRLLEKVKDDNVVFLKTPMCELINGEIKEAKEGANYVDLCVRYKYVKLFFDNITNNALKHRYCDVFFASFIQQFGGDTLKHAEIKLNEPIYVWRHVDYDRNCSVKSNLKSNFDLLKLDENMLLMFDLYMASQGGTECSVDHMIEYFKKSKIGYHTELNTEIIDKYKKIYKDSYKNNVFRINIPVTIKK